MLRNLSQPVETFLLKLGQKVITNNNLRNSSINYKLFKLEKRFLFKNEIHNIPGFITYVYIIVGMCCNLVFCYFSRNE